MAVMSFLACLPAEFDAAKSTLLADSEVPSLTNVFPRLLRSEQSSLVLHEVNVPLSGALVSRHPVTEQPSQGHTVGGIVCHYCHKPGYMKRDCRKWLNKNQGNQYAHGF